MVSPLGCTTNTLSVTTEETLWPALCPYRCSIAARSTRAASLDARIDFLRFNAASPALLPGGTMGGTSVMSTARSGLARARKLRDCLLSGRSDVDGEWRRLVLRDREAMPAWAVAARCSGEAQVRLTRRARGWQFIQHECHLPSSRSSESRCERCYGQATWYERPLPVQCSLVAAMPGPRQ